MYREIERFVFLSKKGDEKAKKELLERLRPLIISSIRRYYNNYLYYDDLVQEGYEEILQCIENYDPSKGAKFLGYVKISLKFHYLNKHRKKVHLSLNEPIGDGEEEIIDLLKGDEIEALDFIINKEEKEFLLKGLNSLTKRQREVVIYYYIDGKSMKEIGEILGISYRTVVNTKTVALNKLKKTIVKY